MFLDDADRLAFIKGLGGQLVSHASGSFWAIYDSAFLLLDRVNGVETKVPALTDCRSSDVTALQKDSALSVAGNDYYVKRLEPDAASGMTVVVLRR